MSFRSLLILIFSLSSAGFAMCERPASVEAANNAIAYLKSDGQKWMDKRGCVSCHQVPLMLWSLNLIGENSECSSDQLAQWNEWSTQAVNFVKPAQKESHDEQATFAANIDTMAGLLLAVPDGGSDTWREKFIRKLCSEQAEDGSWKPCGQLPAQKRPEIETREVTTLWVTLALLRHQADGFDREAALRFVGSTESAKSTERIAVELVVAAELENEQRAAALQTQLINTQRDDGGWGWLTESPSDALATGLALYALSHAGEKEGATVDAAHAFLIRTQLPDGRWKVPGTKANAKGKPTPTANYWGTAWAVIGLLSAE